MARKRLISEVLLEVEAEQARTPAPAAVARSMEEARRHAHTLLKDCGVVYDPAAVDKRLPKLAKNHALEEDLGKILWYIRNKTDFKPRTIDAFWGYLVRTMQYPPFEPAIQQRLRRSKKPIPHREWKYLMEIRRYPHRIREHPPEWLDSSLLNDPSFATVYERFVAVARETLGASVDDDSFRDTKQKTFLNSGETLMTFDLDGLLAQLERMQGLR
ncbi:MAG: hypothetical protein Q7U75_16755 [Desulfobacterales bacterium]|nr:hypothetical protein [Desulfobacterales bacterium]